MKPKAEKAPWLKTRPRRIPIYNELPPPKADLDDYHKRLTLTARPELADVDIRSLIVADRDGTTILPSRIVYYSSSYGVVDLTLDVAIDITTRTTEGSLLCFLYYCNHGESHDTRRPARLSCVQR